MSYVVVAILGSVSGACQAWHFLVPMVTVLAVTIGVTGALRAHDHRRGDGARRLHSRSELDRIGLRHRLGDQNVPAEAERP